MLLDFEPLLRAAGVDARGVLHIGAHLGQELATYRQAGVGNIILVEAQPLLASHLASQADGFAEFHVFAVAAGERRGTATMFTETANAGQSSSLLRPHKHLSQYPHIVFDGEITVEVVALGEFLAECGVDLSPYNVINIDIQGYELPALRGLGDELAGFEAIFAEVNRDELYEGCTRVEDLDRYLDEHGFARTTTNWAGGTWGDALYLRAAH